MSGKIRTLVLVLMLFTHPFAGGAAVADSKRVEIYSLSQNHWDTRYGETLSEIAQQLLPNNPRMQQQLMGDIVSLNPDAFQHNDPDNLMAGTRLWLPGHMTKADKAVNRKTTSVENYSWGNIKRPIR